MGGIVPRPASSAPVPWRASRVTLIRVPQDRTAPFTYAKSVAQKADLLRDAGPADTVLVAWPGEWSMDFFVVDDRAAALAGVGG